MSKYLVNVLNPLKNFVLVGGLKLPKCTRCTKSACAHLKVASCSQKLSTHNG